MRIFPHKIFHRKFMAIMVEGLAAELCITEEFNAGA